MNEFLIALRALADPRTPARAKLIMGAALLYGISPLDLIPDILPLIGQLDDLTFIIIAIVFFLRMSKPVRNDLRRLK